MNRFAKKIVPSVLALAAVAGTALGLNYPITWLSMAPTPFGSPVPNSSVFFLPGVGNVTVTYSLPGTFTQSRFQSGFLTAGNVTSGPDTFLWSNYEAFATIFTAGPTTQPWQVTYTFPSTLPAGSIYLGVHGLGRTTNAGGLASVITVNQNGTFLGDWQGAGGPWGATQFSAGPPFTMMNSVTGAGGADPWWNTKLGIVRIDDATNSVTINASQIAGDGIGLNIGYCPVPAGACPIECPPNQRTPICYEAGRVDNFAAPVDPTTPRPFFASLLSTYAISKPFDDARVNAVCGTTFQNLPCGIVSANLEIRLRAENDIPQNDSIYLQWMGSNFAWGSNISALPGAGGTWNAGQTQTFTLNLGSLSGGLINQMNNSNALDVLVSDDTTVEYARLSITVCPCNGPARVYTVGVADNLTPPTEATSRRARLTALRTVPPFLWKDNDDNTPDRGWGQTFANLPGGIVKADFNIRMKPSFGGAGNDGLAFDLLNLGAPETFSRGFNINTIAPPWTTNPLTNFFFNLGATLPTAVCGSNLLGNFGDRTFDVYVQDDTAVDFARMRVWPCPVMRRLTGIPVDLDGAVDLSTRADGVTLVHYVPASNSDALNIDAHGTEGQQVDFPPGAFDAVPEGVVLSFAMLGDSDDDGEIDSITGGMGKGKALPSANGSMRVAPGPNGTGTCTGPRIRNSQTGASRQLCLSEYESIDVHSRDIQSLGHARKAGRDSHPFTYMKLRDIAFMTLPDGSTFEGDTIEFDSDESSPPVAPEVLSLSWSTEEGSVPVAGELTLLIERVSATVNGASHTAVGPQCILNTNPGSVTLSNIGDSGEDGVEFTLGEAESFGTTVSPNCGGDESAPCGVELSLELTATGRLSDGTTSDVARVRTSGRISSFFDIWTEFPSNPGTPDPLGATALVLDASGLPVGELHFGDSGTPSLRCTTGPQIQKVREVADRTASGGPGVGVTLEFESDVEFNVPGVPPLTGRSVELRPRVVAGTMPPVVQSLTSVRLTGTGMAEIDLTGQTIVPVGSGVPCPADFNQDGGIDGADVDAFYQAWEAGDATADVNADGGIDGSDVETFFEAWENGGC